MSQPTPQPGAQPGRGAQAAARHTPKQPIRVVLVDDHRMFRTGVRSELATEAPGLVEVADGLAGKWGALLLFADDAVEQKPDLAAFLARNPCRGIRYAVLFDGHARTMRPDELLWLAAANTDPRRDVECRDGVLCVDARSKRPGIAGNPSRFPNVVTSLPEVVRKVDERWAEYGLGERLESPSDRYRTLLLSDKAAW